MKTFIPPWGILTILFLVLICLFSSPTKAQTIIIDSTFTTDGEILPFSSNDTIYGLSISGYVTLLSETSLVRVILADDSGNEWMVYEVYPLIAKDTAIEISDECDETCFLEKSSPYSISIQIIDAEIYIYSINLNSTYNDNLSYQQFLAKRSRDQAKVSQMNEIIRSRNWNWRAADNDIVAKYFFEKCIIFTSDKYNLQGFDYYAGGVFKCFTDHLNSPDTISTLTRSFDWRKKHDADLIGSKYYNQGGDGWITPFQNQGNCGSCWVFSSISTVEAVLNLYYHNQLNFDLSQQEVLCFNNGGSCDSGSVFMALNYIRVEGVSEEECLEYGAYDSSSYKCDPDSLCTNPFHKIKINSQFIVPVNNLDTFKQTLITGGPMAVSIKDLKHAMCLIGYEVNDQNITHWIFKNSLIDTLPYFIYDGSFIDFNVRRNITLPVWDTIDSLEHKCLDKDKDG